MPENNKMVVYSIGCPKCKILEKKLQAAGIEYELETDPVLMMEKGFKTAPVLEVDGTTYGFAEAVKLIGTLKKGRA